jgi:ABC-2 type transport system permease protein
MRRALLALLRKEFLQIRRDPVILRLLLVMPMIQLIVLANAATFEVRSARLFVVDQDRSGASRALAQRLMASGRFVPAGASASMAAADAALLDREADAILVVPPAFEADLVRVRHAEVQLVFDAEDGSAAGVMQGYAMEIIRDHAAALAATLGPSPGAPVRGGARAPVIELRRRGWYNASLDYRHYMVPGILVHLVTIVGTLMTALNIVREKEAGTLEQLNVTPVPRAAFIASKLLPLWVIALVELTLGLLVARFLFGVPMVGHVGVVYVAAGIYLVAALGLGHWVSTVAETQQQAVFVTFSIMLIYLLMSGLFTPVRGMPDWVRVVAQANPMLHFLNVVRGVLLKGAGFADLAREFVALAAMGSVVLTASILRYRKRAS